MSERGVGSRGLFFCLEGIDGSGKTTQALALVEWLRARNRRAAYTAEPSKHEIGLLLRSALAGEKEFLPQTLALLFAADRLEHERREISPRLRRGIDVVADRYVFSSLAYQGLDCPREWVEALNSFAPSPDLILYLRVEAGEAGKRHLQREAKDDLFETPLVQGKVVAAYDELLLHGTTLRSQKSLIPEDATKVVVIDAMGEIGEVAKRIQLTMMRMFGL